MLNENPFPTNIAKPRKLDEYYKELLEETHAKRELTLDGTLEKIQSKTLNLMGSLHLNELIQYLEQSLMLIEH